MRKEGKISEIRRLFENIQGEEAQSLWKKFHRFYINDVLYHKYEDSVNEDYYSFVSLWKYTDENGFFDKVFRTHWNKFLHFYIKLIRKTFKEERVIEGLKAFENYIEQDLNSGKFEIPSSYQELLNYIVVLIDLCFDTHTFKSLINGKMVYFRDNNKAKNELLEEKKSHENSLWELKD